MGHLRKYDRPISHEIIRVKAESAPKCDSSKSPDGYHNFKWKRGGSVCDWCSRTGRQVMTAERKRNKVSKL